MDNLARVSVVPRSEPEHRFPGGMDAHLYRQALGTKLRTAHGLGMMTYGELGCRVGRRVAPLGLTWTSQRGQIHILTPDDYPGTPLRLVIKRCHNPENPCLVMRLRGQWSKMVIGNHALVYGRQTSYLPEMDRETMRLSAALLHFPVEDDLRVELVMATRIASVDRVHSELADIVDRHVLYEGRIFAPRDAVVSEPAAKDIDFELPEA